jgi:hypothetical protein
MTSGMRLALEAIAHDLSLAREAPEIAEIESLLVQTHQVWETVEKEARRAGIPAPKRIEPLLIAARQSLSSGGTAFALEDVRDAVDALRPIASLLHGTNPRDME